MVALALVLQVDAVVGEAALAEVGVEAVLTGNPAGDVRVGHVRERARLRTTSEPVGQVQPGHDQLVPPGHARFDRDRRHLARGHDDRIGLGAERDLDPGAEPESILVEQFEVRIVEVQRERVRQLHRLLEAHQRQPAVQVVVGDQWPHLCGWGGQYSGRLQDLKVGERVVVADRVDQGLRLLVGVVVLVGRAQPAGVVGRVAAVAQQATRAGA